MKCRVQWINCDGNPTPDTNDAIGMAVLTDEMGVRRIPICGAHLASMGQIHHGVCNHKPRPGIKPAKWTFEPCSFYFTGDYPMGARRG